MEKMRKDSYRSDNEDRLLAYTIPCRFCHAGVGKPCNGPGVWNGSRPTGVHVIRLKDVVPHPRPARFWWLTAHEEFLAGGPILQPWFDTDL